MRFDLTVFISVWIGRHWQNQTPSTFKQHSPRTNQVKPIVNNLNKGFWTNKVSEKSQWYGKLIDWLLAWILWEIGKKNYISESWSLSRSNNIQYS